MIQDDYKPDKRIAIKQFHQALILLNALRVSITTGKGEILSEPTVIEALKNLGLEHLLTHSTDLRSDLSAWLMQRVIELASQYDPRIRRDCIQIRRLAFFYHYYLNRPASHTQICSLNPSSDTRVANLEALVHWWEITTGSQLSTKLPLPRRVKPKQRIVDDVVPVATRSVGDNIRAAIFLVFDISCARIRTFKAENIPSKILMKSIGEDADMISATHWFARQWTLPKRLIVPHGEIQRLVTQPRSLIVGEAGAGKSTLLRRLTHILCERGPGCAVLIDLHDSAIWSSIEQPAALISQVLDGHVSESACAGALEASALAVLFDHPEALPAPALSRLCTAIASLARVYVASPPFLAGAFAELPRFQMPNVPACFVRHDLRDHEPAALATPLLATPLGVKIVAEMMQQKQTLDATSVLRRLLEHAGLGTDADAFIASCHSLALLMLMVGKSVTAELDKVEVTAWQDAAQTCHALLRAGLIRADKGDFHFAFPQLIQTLLTHSWLPNLLAMLDSEHDPRIVTAARALAGSQDEWIATFLPTLVEAVEANQLSPTLILDAIQSLPRSAIYRCREDVEHLIYRINVAWQRFAPADPQRGEYVRAMQFHLRRHAPPRMHKPAAQVLSEVTEHLTRAEELLDRTALWTAVQLADMTGHGCALRLINQFFDVHPAFQADLLIGCLKVDTQRSFEQFLALLRRPAFVSQSSAGYVATAFPLWHDQFSLSLLLAFVESDVVNDRDPAHHFANEVVTCLHNQSAR